MSATRHSDPHQRVVLVEGHSDRCALQALAARRARDLAGVEIVAIGGAQAIGRALARVAGARVAGLCDAAEAGAFARALERAGLGEGLDRAGMERLGFFVCEADLEDELIRAVGTAGVEGVLEAEGDLRSFRRFQREPAQRERPVEAQLRRFLGTRSGRKAQYAQALVEALDLARAPRPLDGVLAHVR